MPKVLAIADINGRPGRGMVREHLSSLISAHGIDFVLANGENAAGGFGITPALARELFDLGVDCLTMGNHVWDKKELLDYIDGDPRILRPANYPPNTPGSGTYLVEKNGIKYGVMSLLGRVFMACVDCPFQTAARELESLSAHTPLILVDIHAEATSEKQAMGHFLDGKVSAVLGTHTHVATADARILKGGTAYITDLGMTGPMDSVIGVRKDLIIGRFLNQLPVRFEIAPGPAQLEGVILTLDQGGRALAIERLGVYEEKWKTQSNVEGILPGVSNS